MDLNNKLIKEIEHLKNIINDLKKEVRIQRREIGALRAEQKFFLDKDKTPEYNSRLDALEKLSELDQQLYDDKYDR